MKKSSLSLLSRVAGVAAIASVLAVPSFAQVATATRTSGPATRTGSSSISAPGRAAPNASGATQAVPPMNASGQAQPGSADASRSGGSASVLSGQGSATTERATGVAAGRTSVGAMSTLSVAPAANGVTAVRAARPVVRESRSVSRSDMSLASRSLTRAYGDGLMNEVNQIENPVVRAKVTTDLLGFKNRANLNTAGAGAYVQFAVKTGETLGGGEGMSRCFDTFSQQARTNWGSIFEHGAVRAAVNSLPAHASADQAFAAVRPAIVTALAEVTHVSAEEASSRVEKLATTCDVANGKLASNGSAAK